MAAGRLRWQVRARNDCSTAASTINYNAPAKPKGDICCHRRHDHLMVRVLEDKAGRRVCVDLASVGPYQAAQNFEQGALATSVWTQKHMQGATFDLEVYPTQHLPLVSLLAQQESQLGDVDRVLCVRRLC
jgi:hypothetical protein